MGKRKFIAREQGRGEWMETTMRKRQGWGGFWLKTGQGDRSSQALSLVLPDLHIYLGHLLKIRIPRLLGDSDSVGQGQSSDVFHTCNKHLRQVWKHWGSKFIIFALGGVCFSSSSSLSLWELGNSVPTLGLLRAQTAYQPPTANRLLHWVGAQYIFVD